MAEPLGLTTCDGCDCAGTFPEARTGPVGDELSWQFCQDCVRAFVAAYAGTRYQEIKLIRGGKDEGDQV